MPKHTEAVTPWLLKGKKKLKKISTYGKFMWVHCTYQQHTKSKKGPGYATQTLAETLYSYIIHVDNTAEVVFYTFPKVSVLELFMQTRWEKTEKMPKNTSNLPKLTWQISQEISEHWRFCILEDANLYSSHTSIFPKEHWSTRLWGFGLVC